MRSKITSWVVKTTRVPLSALLTDHAFLLGVTSACFCQSAYLKSVLCSSTTSLPPMIDMSSSSSSRGTSYEQKKKIIKNHYSYIMSNIHEEYLRICGDFWLRHQGSRLGSCLNFKTFLFRVESHVSYYKFVD